MGHSSRDRDNNFRLCRAAEDGEFQSPSPIHTLTAASTAVDSTIHKHRVTEGFGNSGRDDPWVYRARRPARRDANPSLAGSRIDEPLARPCHVTAFGQRVARPITDCICGRGTPSEPAHLRTRCVDATRDRAVLTLTRWSPPYGLSAHGGTGPCARPALSRWSGIPRWSVLPPGRPHPHHMRNWVHV